MAIEVTCECGKTLFGPNRSAGKRGRCPECGRVMRMPVASAATEARPERSAARESLALDADHEPRRGREPEPADGSTAIHREPKKKTREPISLDFKVLGINVSIPKLVGFAAGLVIALLVINWWSGVSANFNVLQAESVDAVIAVNHVEYRATSQFKLGGRKPDPNFIEEPIQGTIIMRGSDIISVTHPDPGGDYVFLRGEISQQVMHEQKMESGYDMAFNQDAFKVVCEGEEIQPYLILTDVESPLQLDIYEMRTANPQAFLPTDAPPDKKEVKKDDRGRLASGVYTYTGSGGMTGKFMFKCFYSHDETFGTRESLFPQGVLKYKSPRGVNLKYDYSSGMEVSWSKGCDAWISKSRYIRADGNSMYAKFPVMLLFRKPKAAGKTATLMFAGRKVAKIDVERITRSTVGRTIGKGAAAPDKPAASQPAAKPPSDATPAPGGGGGGGNDISDPLTGYLGAIAKARKRALGVVSDVTMAEIGKAVFFAVEQNNGKWPKDIDEVDRLVPGTKALASKPPRNGNDGYLYIPPAEEVGKVQNPDAVAFIFESRGGKPDPNGNAFFVDGHVGKAPANLPP